MTKTTKMTVAAAIAVVLSGGVAAAASGTLPTQAGGQSPTSDHSGIEAPASQDHSTAPEQTTDQSSDSSKSGAPNTGTHPDNHGAVVSDVARNTDATGADHGAAVSAVARDNTGQNDHAANQTSNAKHHGKP